MKGESLKVRFWSKVSKTDTCWLWIGARDGTGYGMIGHGPDCKVERAHRVSYRMNTGEIPDGMCVCHICDNRSCVRPDHLFLGSYSDNVRDCMRKGRFTRGLNKGGKNARSIFSPVDVAAIRAFRHDGLSQKSIANKFGTHKSNISVLVNGKGWSHIPSERGSLLAYMKNRRFDY